MKNNEKSNLQINAELYNSLLHWYTPVLARDHYNIIYFKWEKSASMH